VLETRPWTHCHETGPSAGAIFYGTDGVLVTDGSGRYATYLGERKEPGPRGEAEDNKDAPMASIR